MTVEGLERHPFEIPLVRPFRSVSARSGVLVRGPAGWGEFSPFPEYKPDVTRRWWQAAVEAATIGWPAPLRNTIAVNVTVPAVEPDVAHEIVSASGCATAKVKVADKGIKSLAEDLARVEAVRDALGPSGKLRVDANAAWSLRDAVRAIKALAQYDLEYVEQPIASIEQFGRLKVKTDVRLAVDESLRNAPDPHHVAGIDAADIAVLKVQPLGGVARALEIADAVGLPAVVSSAVETSIGLASGLALASLLPDLPFACGLGTITMLDGDVVEATLAPTGGVLHVIRPSVDLALLAKWSPTPGTAESLLEQFDLAGREAAAA